MIRCVFDTDVVVAAVRSREGASAALVRHVLDGELVMVASVALAIEYEAVATRPMHLIAGETDVATVLNIIDALITLAQKVETHFHWRPQLRDADDEMVLEAAVNAGCIPIVTFNARDFAGAARFGVEVLRPLDVLERLRR